MEDMERLQLNINLDEIESFSDYKQALKRFSPVEAANITENEKCKHNMGDTFIYNNHYHRPDGICPPLNHVLQLYVWRASLGFPSWEPDDPRVYRIHCPAKRGTVWELRRCEDDAAARES